LIRIVAGNNFGYQARYLASEIIVTPTSVAPSEESIITVLFAKTTGITLQFLNTRATYYHLDMLTGSTWLNLASNISGPEFLINNRIFSPNIGYRFRIQCGNIFGAGPDAFITVGVSDIPTIAGVTRLAAIASTNTSATISWVPRQDQVEYAVEFKELAEIEWRFVQGRMNNSKVEHIQVTDGTVINSNSVTSYGIWRTYVDSFVQNRRNVIAQVANASTTADEIASMFVLDNRKFSRYFMSSVEFSTESQVGYIGSIFRYQNKRNFMLFEMGCSVSSPSSRIRVVLDGNYKTVANISGSIVANVSNGDWHTLAIQTLSGRIIAYYDAKPLFNISDPLQTLTWSTVGLTTTNNTAFVYFDRLRAESPALRKTMVTIPALESGKRYAIRVIAANSVGSEQRQFAQVVVVDTSPIVPSVPSIVVIALNPANFTFIPIQPQATSFSLLFNMNPPTHAFDGLASESGVGFTVTSVDSSGLSPLMSGTMYSMSLIAHNFAGDSAPYEFNVQPSSASPSTLTDIATRISVNMSAVALRWDPVPSASMYKISIKGSTDKSFTEVTESVGINNLAFTIQNLNPGEVYTVRITAGNNVGGYASEAATRTICTSSGNLPNHPILVLNRHAIGIDFIQLFTDQCSVTDMQLRILQNSGVYSDVALAYTTSIPTLTHSNAEGTEQLKPDTVYDILVRGGIRLSASSAPQYQSWSSAGSVQARTMPLVPLFVQIPNTSGEITVYVNGKLLPINGSDGFYEGVVHQKIRTIAIRVFNATALAVSARVPWPIVSDSSWRCFALTSEFSGWEGMDYDDSAWRQPSTLPHDHIMNDAITPNAEWIESPAADRPILLCRHSTITSESTISDPRLAGYFPNSTYAFVNAFGYDSLASTITNITVHCRVRLRSISSTCSGQIFSAAYNGLGWGLEYENKRFKWIINRVVAISPTELIEDQWYHILGTFNGSSITLHIDGVEVATTTVPVTYIMYANQTVSQRQVVIMKHSNVTTDGWIDDAAIHAVVLSSDTIRIIAWHGTTPPKLNLISWHSYDVKDTARVINSVNFVLDAQLVYPLLGITDYHLEDYPPVLAHRVSKLQAISITNTSVQLSWIGGLSTCQFEIESNASSVFDTIGIISENSFTVVGLDPSTTYSFIVNSGCNNINLHSAELIVATLPFSTSPVSSWDIPIPQIVALNSSAVELYFKSKSATMYRIQKKLDSSWSDRVCIGDSTAPCDGFDDLYLVLPEDCECDINFSQGVLQSSVCCYTIPLPVSTADSYLRIVAGNDNGFQTPSDLAVVRVRADTYWALHKFDVRDLTRTKVTELFSADNERSVSIDFGCLRRANEITISASEVRSGTVMAVEYGLSEAGPWYGAEDAAGVSSWIFSNGTTIITLHERVSRHWRMTVSATIYPVVSNVTIRATELCLDSSQVYDAFEAVHSGISGDGYSWNLTNASQFTNKTYYWCKTKCSSLQFSCQAIWFGCIGSTCNMCFTIPELSSQVSLSTYYGISYRKYKAAKRVDDVTDLRISEIHPDQFTISFTVPSSAYRYRVDVYDEIIGTWITSGPLVYPTIKNFDGTLTAEIIVTSLPDSTAFQAGVTYVIRVVSGNYLALSDPFDDGLTVISVMLTGASPENGVSELRVLTVDSSSVTLEWSQDPAATHYIVEVLAPGSSVYVPVDVSCLSITAAKQYAQCSKRNSEIRASVLESDSSLVRVLPKQASVVTGISPTSSGAYTFKVTSYNNYGNGETSSTCLGAPSSSSPAGPTALKILSLSSSQIAISYFNPSATQYAVYLNERMIISGLESLLFNLDVASFAQNETVTVSVVAGNIHGDQDFTNSPSQKISLVNQAPQSVPSGLRVSQFSDGGVTIAWEHDSSALFYLVSSRPCCSEPFLDLDNGNVTSTSFTITSVVTGSMYEFAVTSGNNFGTASDHASIIVQATTGAPVLALEGLRATSLWDDFVTLQWNAVSDSTGYRIEMKTDDPFAEWELVTSFTSDTHFTIDKLQVDRVYIFQVVATNNFGTCIIAACSISVSIMTMSTVPMVDLNISITDATQSSLAFAWAADIRVSDYSVYLVEISPTNSSIIINSTLVSTTTNLNPSYAVADANSDTVYTYVVVAANSHGTQNVSQGSMISVLTSSDVESFSVIIDDVQTETITLSWTLSRNAEKYIVSTRVVRTDSFTQVASVLPRKNYQLQSLNPEESIDIRVSGFTPDGSSSYEFYIMNIKPSSAVPLPIRELNITRVSQNEVTLRWEAPVSATKFLIYVRPTTEPSWQIAATTNQINWDGIRRVIEQTVSNLNSTTQYSFFVKSGNSFGFEPIGSSIVSMQPSSSVPKSVNVSLIQVITNSLEVSPSFSATITWEAVPTASYYIVQYKKSSQSENIFGTTRYPPTTLRSTTHVQLNLEPSTLYNFRIFAGNSNGLSDSVDLLEVATNPIQGELLIGEGASVSIQTGAGIIFGDD
jgi:hypothetical protein